MNKMFFYGTDNLTVQTAIMLAEGTLQGQLSEAAKQKIRESQHHVEQMVSEGKTVYGVTTGFGILANTRINFAVSTGIGSPTPTL